MKSILKYIRLSMACIAATAFVASCDTDVESVDINNPGVDNQNPGLYQNYLANLRTYKKAPHKVAFGWFDNSDKVPCSQGKHIHSVPDSLDYIVLDYPDNLAAFELAEMNEVREKKGTKVLFEINFEGIKVQYDNEKKDFEAENEDPTKEFPALNSYLVDTVSAKLALVEKYNYDGVIMAFNGKLTTFMTEAEKAEFIAQQNIFIGIANDWADRHANKELILMGKPQNILTKEVFDKAKYLILPAQSEISASGLTYLALKALEEGVPTDRFVALVNAPSLDPSDTKTGYWGKVVAINGAARWAAAEYKGFVPAGIGIKGMNNDYYNSAFTYPNVRTAISIINPNAKN